ncbi:MAG: efflux RND transporter permease subunit, partial [Microbacterium sp.]
GHGGFISQPLAIVVIGGLLSSTVLTLIVLPTLYNLVEGAKERRRARKHGGGKDAGDSPALVDATASASASALPHAPQLTRRELRERGE